MWLTALKKYWRPALAGLAVVLALAGLLYVRALRADNARLAAEAAREKASAAAMAGALRAQGEALAVRQAENETLAGVRSADRAGLERSYETEEEACGWAAGRVPDSVYDRLCR